MKCTKADGDTNGLAHPSSRFPTEYSEPLWSEELPCYRVYDAYVLKGLFTEVLSDSICNSVNSYIGSKEIAKVHDLACQAPSLTKFQHGSLSANAPRCNDKMDQRSGNSERRDHNIYSMKSSPSLVNFLPVGVPPSIPENHNSNIVAAVAVVPAIVSISMVHKMNSPCAILCFCFANKH